MTWLLPIRLVAVMAGIVYVLVRGVVLMASGKDMTGEQSQLWMRRRVWLQAVAIVILVLLLVIAGASRG
jgi:NADH:ubiquinone oxidoreductase subunit 6 (subunit J)